MKPAATRKAVPPADPLRYAPSPERPLRGKARTMEQQMDILPHRHDWGQLVFSISGAVRVSTEQSTFIVPPSRAVWIPVGVVHAVTAIEQADLRTLYVLQGLLTEPAWSGCRVLEVSPLLRELVLQVVDESSAVEARREALVGELVVDELRRARPLSLGVALPSDARLRKLCEAMLAAPARHQSLEAWAAEVGASARTVTRLFREQLGTSFNQWRSQVLLAHALTLAARRRPMSHIASELGYANASAFSAMVRRTVGMPPSRFFAAA
ncbi:helix-turn-helix transcriptional regulator [Pelomonas sp. SE-A7]|uniref:AraC family transcriptional regulator n=1 Tax=Pelomonas sp. SE-A7 TaxID=3054953 RepID=UPI00259D2740|nr:helix-turn-helix transcriptional regulator [Pelomonas sp. SE-A7]MDM4765803.1 helix-turn-helix transcriptional regulator [Pelomonas sp. SE-A7]